MSRAEDNDHPWGARTVSAGRFPLRRLFDFARTRTLAVGAGFGRMVVSEDNRGTQTARKSGVQSTSGSRKRRCDWTLVGRRAHPRHAAHPARIVRAGGRSRAQRAAAGAVRAQHRRCRGCHWARSHSRFVITTRPLHTRITNIFDTSFSDTTMRPNLRRTLGSGRSTCRWCCCTWRCERRVWNCEQMSDFTILNTTHSPKL